MTARRTTEVRTVTNRPLFYHDEEHELEHVGGVDTTAERTFEKVAGRPSEKIMCDLVHAPYRVLHTVDGILRRAGGIDLRPARKFRFSITKPLPLPSGVRGRCCRRWWRRGYAR
jgi:hypothetical protein